MAGPTLMALMATSATSAPTATSALDSDWTCEKVQCTTEMGAEQSLEEQADIGDRISGSQLSALHPDLRDLAAGTC